jgi:hypothetical protein
VGVGVGAGEGGGSGLVAVRVAVRCRPLSTREREAGGVVCVELPDDESVAVRPAGADADRAKTFRFDKVYDGTVSQETVYRCVCVCVCVCV